ncbi:MAG: alcohol dehydrogenase catalytic domain-containing protein [Gemmatimonadota bacterium]|jgi:propanol-preferring alcohol dehydrogenase
MRAWILRTPAPMEEQPLTLVDVPTPEPGPHEVRIKVSVCGICRTDLHIAEGDLPAGKNDLVLGHEIVGVVDALGEHVGGVSEGERVGVTWLGRTCGQCRHCAAGRENYCADFQATGRDVDGGFAEYAVAHETAVFSLGRIALPQAELTPFLCAGVAGYCAYRLMDAAQGTTIGLYGFGPTAYYVLRVARHFGHGVFVSSRSARKLGWALHHGADWTGTAKDEMPGPLDAAIVFPPAGELVEQALEHIKPGGALVLAPVAMSEIQIADYSRHFWGRDIRTLYNVNRRDAEAFLALAARLDLGLPTEVVPFGELQKAMMRLKRGQIAPAHVAVGVRESEMARAAR